jgi:hypothetical protein
MEAKYFSETSAVMWLVSHLNGNIPYFRPALMGLLCWSAPTAFYQQFTMTNDASAPTR